MPALSLRVEHALVEGAGDGAAAEQGRGEADAFLIGKAGHLDRERQSLAAPVEIGDAGNRGDEPERPVPFAGVAHGVVMRAQHQAGQARPLALVAAADIADGIEMRGHAGVPHPRQQEIGRGAVLGGEEDPRQMIRRLGDRAERVDPADDFPPEIAGASVAAPSRRSDIGAPSARCAEIGVPVLRDLQPRRHPDPVMACDVIEKAHQRRRPARPADDPAMQAHRHHLRRRSRLRHRARQNCP